MYCEKIWEKEGRKRNRKEKEELLSCYTMQHKNCEVMWCNSRLHFEID